MSVLGPLFVPRKDIIPVPKVKDNPELEKYLDDLSRRIATNELAIQRWANSAPRLAAVVGTCSSSVAMNSVGPGFSAIFPLDGSSNAFFSGIVDVGNNAFVLPQAGWYLISATILWDVSAIGGDHAGSVEVELFKNGNTAPGSALTSSGSNVEMGIAAAPTYPSISVPVDYSTINFTGIFNANDYIQFYGFNFIFLVATNPPGVVNPNTAITGKITTCAVEFLGGTPSKVQ